MIKNFFELNEREIKSFKRTYKRYLIEFSDRPSFDVIEKLDDIMRKKKADEYTERMIESIINGENIGIVSIEIGHVDSFIVGKAAGDTGIMEYAYIDKSLSPRDSRQRLLELYSTFASELKRLGCTKVMAEPLNSATEFIDDLNSLDFETWENYRGSSFSVYGKKL